MPSERKKKVKLEDIARASGVSLAAVSLVLSDKPGISQETRARVLETARSMGYVFKLPLPLAPEHPLRRAGILVREDDAGDPACTRAQDTIVKGAQAAVEAVGASIETATWYPGADIQSLFSRPVDGLVTAGLPVSDLLSEALGSAGCPVVLVNAPQRSPLFDEVRNDYRVTGRQAVEFLVQRGCRRVFLYPGLALHGSEDAADLLSGYTLALESSLLHPPLVARTTDEIHAFLSGSDARTGVVAWDDAPAGLETLDWITIQPNFQTMGRLAVQVITHRLSLPDTGRVTVVLNPLRVCP